MKEIPKNLGFCATCACGRVATWDFTDFLVSSFTNKKKEKR